MNVIEISAAGKCAPTLALGKRGENLATEVRFDFSAWAEEFGEGRVELYARRCGDENAYPVTVTVDGTTAVWTLTATDTHVVGYGTAEFVWVAGETVVKSVVFGTFVEPDIGAPTDTPPEPYESWLDTLTELAADTEDAAQRAAQSAEDAAQSAETAASAATEAAEKAAHEAVSEISENASVDTSGLTAIEQLYISGNIIGRQTTGPARLVKIYAKGIKSFHVSCSVESTKRIAFADTVERNEPCYGTQEYTGVLDADAVNTDNHEWLIIQLFITSDSQQDASVYIADLTVTAASAVDVVTRSATAALETLLASLDTKALKYIKQTSNEDDMNELWDTGVYVSRSTANTPQNSPTTGKFVMLVIGNNLTSGLYRHQLVFGKSGILWSRSRDGSSTVADWSRISLNDTWTAQIDAVDETVYSLNKNQLPVDSMLVKGNYNTAGKITTGVAVSTYPMYDLKPGTRITMDIPEDVNYSVWEGDTRTSTKRTHRKIKDASFTTVKRFLGFMFYKEAEESPHDTTIEEIQGTVSIGFDFEAGGIDVSDYVPDMPESAGQTAVMQRAAQVVELPFTAAADIPWWGSTRVIAEGSEQQGIPYCSARPECLFVPNCVSLHTFMTATLNPNSYLYTKKVALPSYAGHTYYGAVCSSFVAWCYGIDDAIPNTASFATYPGFTALEQQDIQNLKLGDMLNDAGDHIIIVTGLYRNKYGHICYVEISEETSATNVWGARTILRSANYLSNRLNPQTGYVIYRYDYIDDVTYEPSPWVHLDVTESGEPVYSTLLSPRRGARSNWHYGEAVEIDILGEHSYTDYQLTNLDTSTTTTGSVSGALITLTGLDHGRYRLRLTDGSNYSDYVYFDVIRTAGTTFEVLSGRKVDVTWNAYVTPCNISFCNSNSESSSFMGSSASRVLTDEEIAAGHVILDAPAADETKAPGDVWLMRFLTKTEFGLHASQFTAVDVTATGTIVTEQSYVQSEYIADITPQPEPPDVGD